MGFFLTFLQGLIQPITGFFKEKQALKAAVNERKDQLIKLELETKLEGIKNASQADISMDVNSRGVSGWMDDVSFFIFLLPAVLAFIPSMVPHVTAGFIALESMPQLYQYALGGMLIAVWGYRRLVTPLIQAGVKAYLGTK